MSVSSGEFLDTVVQFPPANGGTVTDRRWHSSTNTFGGWGARLPGGGGSRLMAPSLASQCECVLMQCAITRAVVAGSSNATSPSIRIHFKGKHFPLTFVPVQLQYPSGART